MVEIEVAPVTEHWMTHSQAMLYCFLYYQDNKKGWRLPTFAEYLQNDAIAIQAMHRNEDIINTDLKLLVQPVRDLT